MDSHLSCPLSSIALLLVPLGLSPSCLSPSRPLSDYLPAPVCLSSILFSLYLTCCLYPVPHPHTTAFAAAGFPFSSLWLPRWLVLSLRLPTPHVFLLSHAFSVPDPPPSLCVSPPFCPTLSLSLPLCPHPASLHPSPHLPVSGPPSGPLQPLRLSGSGWDQRGARPAPHPQHTRTPSPHGTARPLHTGMCWG